MLVRALALLAAASAALAQSEMPMKVTQPGANWWWIVNSQNTLAWEGKVPSDASPAGQFLALLTNPDVKLLTAPTAIDTMTSGYDYSRLLQANQANWNPGKGYKVQLTNPINQTQVYGESEEFEIKTQNSPYPSSSSSSASGSATGSAGSSGSGSSAASPSSTGKSGAMTMHAPAFAAAAVGVAAYVLV